MTGIFDKWKDGPDTVIPSNIYFTHKIDEPVRLRFQGDDQYKYPPLSLYTLMKQTSILKPNHLAHVTIHNDKVIKTLTYQEYWNHTILAAKSLIKLGVSIDTCVSIYAKNSSKWLIIELGTIFAGGAVVGHSVNPSIESIEFVLTNSKSSIIFVEDNEHLENVLKIKSIEFKWIIQMNDEINEKHKQYDFIIDWNQFINNAARTSDDAFNERLKSIAPNKCAVLCYTSGTTAKPKACMLSHDNLIFAVRRMCDEQTPLTHFKTRLISFYPLFHIAGQFMDFAMPIGCGATLYFIDFDSDESLIENIKFVKPTFICGIPSILNYHKSAMTEDLNSLANVDQATKTSFLKLKYGLDECKFFLNGGAPLTNESLDFFKQLEIIIYNYYSSSESILQIVSKYPENDLYALGKVTEPITIKIGNDNELLINGRNLFMGYLNEEQRNSASFDSDNWFHTGDMGRIDDRGQLFFTGRIKEIIKTAYSMIIAPRWIEEAITNEMKDLISKCVIVGESKPFLTALITLKSKFDNKTKEPLDELDSTAVKTLETFGLHITKTSEVANLDPSNRLFDWMREKIETATKKSQLYATVATENAKIEKFVILNRDLSRERGEITETKKVRRDNVIENFKHYIDKVYEA